MAEYNPSKIIKDGNTYNFRDTTKIPLAGSNQISGDLIPATDNSIDVGSSTNNIKMLYTKGITIDGTQFLPSDYIPRSGGEVLNGYIYSRNVSNDSLVFTGGNALAMGAYMQLNGENRTNEPGCFNLIAKDSTNLVLLKGTPSGTLTWGSKNIAMQEDVIPRAGGAVMTGYAIAEVNNNSRLILCGGIDYSNGASVAVYGKDYSLYGLAGAVAIGVQSYAYAMYMYAGGTWTWSGTACQITSDQRLKQQITEIDNALLDAWEDVNPVQFKYNDAVKEKSDNARLHTGYVVQQIDDACKSHGVDISKYGLYCHEEYEEETREVEQADGTKKTEVVRPASEHYSLRYTEALIVECAYLRKKLKELTARIEQLEKGNNIK